MRTAITLQRLHGEKTFQVITGPEVHIEAQIRAFKDVVGKGKEHPEIAEIEIWNSASGLLKRFRFTQPKPAAVTAESKQLDEKPETPVETPDEPAEPAPEAEAEPAPAPPKNIFRRRKGD